MSSVWLSRFFVAVAALLLPATVLDAALPKHNPAPQAVWLTGQLLVASPRMGDPRFRRTVILMVRHNAEGALGVTINRPIGERPLADVLEKLGDENAEVAGSVRVFAGGPVQPDRGFIVHTPEYRRQGTIDVNEHVAVTTSKEVLRDLARNQGPQKAFLAFGYAGWAPGQLEGELARDDWLVAPADATLIFEEPRDRVWDEAMARRAREP